MTVKVLSILCFLLFVLFRTHQVQADVFTALADLEPLLETEHVLLDSLAAYLKYQEERINILKMYASVILHIFIGRISNLFVVSTMNWSTITERR